MQQSFLFFLLLFFWAQIGESQTPASPVINYAHQQFEEAGHPHSTRKLSVAQGISPRVCKPGPGQSSEKIEIMFKGHWLDFTRKVQISNPGINFSQFVEQGNKDWGVAFSEMYPPYNGPAVVVEFELTNSAMVGTYGIHLRRPNALGGWDENVFYIEVMDVVRIHDIKFKKSGEAVFRSSGREGETGEVIIQGQNLDRITGFTATGPFRNVAVISRTPLRMNLAVTLGPKGIVGYNAFMSMALPGGLKNIEYPLSQLNINTGLRFGEMEILRAASANSTTCNFLQSLNTTLTAGTVNPAPEPNLQLSFINGFTTGSTTSMPISEAEKSQFSLCTTTGRPSTTTIPALTVRVTNSGNGASSPTTLYLCTAGNSNFSSSVNFNVPALGPGSFVNFSVPRLENRVVTLLNASGVCVRQVSSESGIGLWSDAGIQASLYNRISNGNLQARNLRL